MFLAGAITKRIHPDIATGYCLGKRRGKPGYVTCRLDQGFDHFSVAFSIVVMKMARSDLAASGVMFTFDTETGFRDVVLINGSCGLGDNIVQGTVNPDEYYVFKPALNKGFRPVIRKKPGDEKMDDSKQ